MDQRAIIFLHIPKTAGTTLNRIIEWQYNPLSIFTIDPYGFRATAERLRQLPEERRRRLRMVRGHCYYGLHNLLPQGATYLTMLRDPVKRLLSSYFFIQRRPLHPLHRKVKGERLTVEEFLRLTAHRQNLQTGMVAGIKADKCAPSTLELAKENLVNAFGVTGICERFEESLVLAALTFDWDIPFYENRKVTKMRSQVDPAAIELIKEYNQMDLELYRFGSELFQAAVDTRRQEIEGELARLRALPRPGSIENWYNSAMGAGRFLITKVASAV
ncbi:MAG TPA: sulfotransferase family 2 domain-containing protein [Chthoniobacterales bacterium]|jgi:hypothetical protein